MRVDDPMKHCILIQAHKDIDYFLEFAHLNEQTNFYIHMDKKSNFNLTTSQKNVFFVKNSINVYWGGWSQVEATLLLIDLALQNEENYYFHLCSGEDVVLQKFNKIEYEWQNKFTHAAMIESSYSKKHQYRTRYNQPQANKNWQISLAGKLVTRLYKYLNTVVPNSDYPLYGSQWFSITRNDALIIDSMSKQHKSLFEKKLCPDEHFFQFLVNKSDIRVANNNRRIIIFDEKHNNGNNPLYLDSKDLLSAKEAGFWFARKVNRDVALNFLHNHY